MTALLHRPTDPSRPAHHAAPARTRRARRPLVAAGVAAAMVIAVVCSVLVAVGRVRDGDLHRDYLAANGWPRSGQAAYQVGGTAWTSPAQHAVPIASVAKVMTAYVVLEHLPLHGTQAGPTMTLDRADVRDYERRRGRGESVLRVRDGERLTERDALLALLLPSANNVAVLLARRVAGSVPRFVRWMNDTAAGLHMNRTHYTDPSGYANTTVSTAGDQLLLAARLTGADPTATALTDLASNVSARLPVVGTVRSTDGLLGWDGFIGTKTGSDDAAGGCFMFRTYRVVAQQVSDVVGVVLGQRGRHDITAGLYAARQLADRIGTKVQG